MEDKSTPTCIGLVTGGIDLRFKSVLLLEILGLILSGTNLWVQIHSIFLCSIYSSFFTDKWHVAIKNFKGWDWKISSYESHMETLIRFLVSGF
jgi:hypothetical protein